MRNLVFERSSEEYPQYAVYGPMGNVAHYRSAYSMSESRPNPVMLHNCLVIFGHRHCHQPLTAYDSRDMYGVGRQELGTEQISQR